MMDGLYKTVMKAYEDDIAAFILGVDRAKSIPSGNKTATEATRIVWQPPASISDFVASRDIGMRAALGMKPKETECPAPPPSLAHGEKPNEHA